jgi:hypothetical protein
MLKISLRWGTASEDAEKTRLLKGTVQPCREQRVLLCGFSR